MSFQPYIERDRVVFHVYVVKADISKVIGEDGAIARALPVPLFAAGGKYGAHFGLEIEEALVH